MRGQVVKDQSADRKYFIMTPQLVWAKCESPYEYTVWNVIKMIAGEYGECFLSTQQLAEASMMSTGKVSECRKELIRKGLLDGEMRKDPGYPQPVWHLEIPDVWEENLTWRKGHDKLRERFEYKKAYSEEQNKQRQKEPSPGEEGYSPGEEGYSPGETKKNQQVEPKGERASPENSDSDIHPDALFPPPIPLGDQSPPKKKQPSILNQTDPISMSAEVQKRRGADIPDWAVLGAEGIDPHYEIVVLFCEMTRQEIPTTKSEGSSWLRAFKKFTHEKGFTLGELKQTVPRMGDDKDGKWCVDNGKWPHPATKFFQDKLAFRIRQQRLGPPKINLDTWNAAGARQPGQR